MKEEEEVKQQLCQISDRGTTNGNTNTGFVKQPREGGQTHDKGGEVVKEEEKEKEKQQGKKARWRSKKSASSQNKYQYNIDQNEPREIDIDLSLSHRDLFSVYSGARSSARGSVSKNVFSAVNPIDEAAAAVTVEASIETDTNVKIVTNNADTYI